MSVVPSGPARWPDGFVTVSDGTRLHYVEAGDGAPVILLHGARGSAIGNWFSNGIAPKLAETNHVYALDMRGHGLSGGERHGHLHMAADVIAFMDQMGVEKAHIAGYSMGGGVMLQILAKAPHRFLTACFQGSGVSETAEWRDRVPARSDSLLQVLRENFRLIVQNRMDIVSTNSFASFQEIQLNQEPQAGHTAAR